MVASRKTRYSRVCKALPHHFERLRKVRELRAKLLAKDAGSDYPGLDGVIYGDVINLAQQARLAAELSLAATTPRFAAVTHSYSREARAFAEKFGRAMNKYMPRIGMKSSLRTIVGEGYISLGIGKTFLADSLPIALEQDVNIIPGKPFFAPRNVDHFVWDQDATDFRYCTIFADRYRATWEMVASDKRIPANLRNKIFKAGPDSMPDSAESEVQFNQKYDYSSETSVAPWSYLADVYLPEERLIQTYAVGDDFGPTYDEPLFEIEWTGRPLGPYHFFNLGPTPAGTIPSSPAQNVVNLHNFSNTLFRKLRDQAERSKQLTVSRSGDEDDAEIVRAAKDGHHITLNDPESIKELKLEGIDQQIYSMLMTTIAMFDRAGGNVQARLGTGPAADTAKQEAIISGQVDRLEGHFQSQFVDFLTDVGRELGAMLYEDAATEIPMSQEIGDTGIYVPDDWRGAYEEGARFGSFDIYEINPIPFSGSYRPPAQRMAEIDAIVQQLMPLEPLLNQRGKALNVDRYLQLKAEYGDLPELTYLYEEIEPPADNAEPAGLLADAKQRQYTHVNVNGSQPADPMAEMMASAGAA